MVEFNGKFFKNIFIFFLILGGASIPACDSAPGGTIDLNSTLYGENADKVVECSRGVVSSDGLRCVNANVCNGQTALCKDGFVCLNNSCQPIVPCASDGDCGAGKCDLEGGACVNPKKCIYQKETCVPGYACSPEGVCELVKDGCENGCSFGYCDKKSGQCVRKEPCSPSTEVQDCGTGFVCTQDGNKCVNEVEYCTKNVCDRGVCDARNQGCVDKETCEVPEDCITGKTCVSGQCVRHRCPEDEDCSAAGRAGGVCDLKSGECVQSPNCQKRSDCFKGYLCVKREANNECMLENSKPEDFCKPRCAGRQRCEKTEEQGLALFKCVSPEECKNTADCQPSDVCQADVSGGSRCGTVSGSCVPDDFEGTTGNDHVDLATVLQDPWELTDLSLCGDDIDYYKYKKEKLRVGLPVVFTITLKDELDEGNGILVAELYDSYNGGLEEKLKVTNYDETTKSFSNTIAIKYVPQSKENLLDLILKVSRRSMPGGIEIRANKTVNYSLKVLNVSDEIFTECRDARELPLTIGSGTSLVKTSRVTVGDGSATEFHICNNAGAYQLADSAWEFKVKKEMFVTVSVVPEKDVNLNVALFKNCLEQELAFVDSEDCSVLKRKGSPREISGILQPGTYTVLVSEASAGSGGGYTIQAKGEETSCVEKVVRKCKDTDTLSTCNDSRTDAIDVQCEKMCDTEQKECRENLGLSCANSANVSKGFDIIQKVDFSEHESENIGLPDGNCTDVSQGDKTAGRNISYKVTLKPKEAVFAQVRPVVASAKTDLVLYILEGCSSNTCVLGSDKLGPGKGEQLFYQNNDVVEKEFFVVVDQSSVDPPTQYPEVEVELKVYEPRCKPGVSECNGNREFVSCNDEGTGFKAVEYCKRSVGCDDSTGKCREPEGDSCGSAIPLTAASILHNQELKYYHSYGVQSDCGGGEGNFANVYYRFDTGKTKEQIKFKVEPLAGSKFNPKVWWFKGAQGAQSACSNYACVGSVNSRTSGGEEIINIVGETDSVYYFVVESAFSTKVKDFVFDVSLETSAFVACDHAGFIPTCKSNQYTYCDPVLGEQSVDCGPGYVCDTGTGFCKPDSAGEEGDGRSCQYPFVVDATSKVKGEVNLTQPNGHPLSNEFKFIGGYSIGQCLLPDNQLAITPVDGAPGKERIVAFKLKENSTLFVDIELKGTSNKGDLIAYFTKNCSVESCVGYRGPGVASVSYHADSDEYVYLVIDSAKENSSAPLDGYTVKWELRKDYECSPGTITCCAASDSSCGNSSTTSAKVTYCSSNGYAGEYLCPSTGCDSFYRCSYPKNGNSCDSPSAIESGTSIVVEGKDYKIGPPGATYCGTAGIRSMMFVSLRASENDLILVEGRSLSAPFFAISKKPFVFIKKVSSVSCNEVDTKCDAFDEGGMKFNDPGSIKYTVESAGLYVIGLGSFNLLGKYLYDVRVLKGNVCEAPISLTAPSTVGASFVHRYNLGDYQGNYNPSSNTNCDSLATPGDDMVFSVEVPDGGKLKVKVEGTKKDDDFAFYVTQSKDACKGVDIAGLCISAEDEPVSGSLDTQEAEIHNSTGSNVTYYITVDSKTATAGDFKLTITKTQ